MTTLPEQAKTLSFGEGAQPMLLFENKSSIKTLGEWNSLTL